MTIKFTKFFFDVVCLEDLVFGCDWPEESPQNGGRGRTDGLADRVTVQRRITPINSQ